MTKKKKKKNIKNAKMVFIIEMIFVIIILIWSSYAIYRYLRTLNAVGMTNKNITVRFVGGNNNIDIANAYPISDSYAITNLDNLSYVDWTVTHDENSPSVNYEIYLTAKDDNTMDSKYIKVYLTDGNKSELVSPSKYSSLTSNTYGKVVFRSSLTGNESKNYRLYAWIDKDFSDNTVSRNFSFYVNIYAYIDSNE